METTPLIYFLMAYAGYATSLHLNRATTMLFHMRLKYKELYHYTPTSLNCERINYINKEFRSLAVVLVAMYFITWASGDLDVTMWLTFAIAGMITQIFTPFIRHMTSTHTRSHISTLNSILICSIYAKLTTYLL